MYRKWLGGLALIVVATALLNLLSCAHSQELVSIQVQPAVETFGASNIPVQFNAGSQVQLRALGSYIHPPVVKDITSQATWASNDTQMFTLSTSTPGLLTATGNQCGGTLVSATMTTNSSAGGISSKGALVTGYMTANVTCFTGTGNGNPVLLVQFANANSGSVASSPAGLGTCVSPGPCNTQAFLSGTVVVLTATPSGSSTTATWAQCPSSNGSVCTVDLTGDTIVIVSFQ